MSMRVVSEIGILMLFLVLGVGCRGTKGVASHLEPPPGAAIAGLNRLAFKEDFQTAAGIDWQNTRKPGFSFYLARPFGWPATSADAVSVRDGVLTINNPVNKAQFDLCSAASAGGGEWVGFAPRGPAYFEAAIAFDPEPPEGRGFPAFWTMSAEHLFGTLWQQTKSRYQYLENDFMEWNAPSWHSPDAYIHSLHVWTNDRTLDVPYNKSVQFPKHHKGSGGKVIGPFPGVDWREFNIFATLWIPGDRIDTYFNNQLVRSFDLSEHPEFNVGNDQHFPAILGSGNFPMRVDWVRVWMP